MFKYSGSSAEVVAGGFKTFCGPTIGGQSELGVEGGEVVENVGELELEVVLGYRAFTIISKSRIPCEVYSNLPSFISLRILSQRGFAQPTSMGNFPPIQESWLA